MDKILDYVCNEMKDIERKVSQGGRLNMQETQYLDLLAHTKKNLLTGEAMMEGDSHDRSYEMSSRRGRDSMGRYVSRDEGYNYRSGEGKDELIAKLKEIVTNY